MIGINAVKIKLLFLSFVFLYPITVKAESMGEQLYAQNCMVCHAYDGSGAMAGVIDLEENRAWSTIDGQLLFKRLKQGIQKTGGGMSMPAKGGNPKLTDNELKKTIDYMRQSFLK